MLLSLTFSLPCRCCLSRQRLSFGITKKSCFSIDKLGIKLYKQGKIKNKGVNMKKLIFILLVLPILVGTVFAETLATLTGIMKPESISIDDRQIYVMENKKFFIYSLQDFKLKKKFGKEGEGPQEFKGMAHLIPLADYLLINSAGKISYFTTNGDFIKEMKSPTGFTSSRFYPLDNGFVGRGSIQEQGILYGTINFFDEHLEKGKELYRMKSTLQPDGKIEMLKQPFLYKTYKNKVYVAGKPGFIIDILDHTGKLLLSIDQKYEKVKFTGDDEKKVRNALRLLYKQQYEELKHRLAFPGYYPEIGDFQVTDNKIYVFTWKVGNGSNEWFVYDLQGKLLKRLFVPLVFMMPLEPFPYTVNNGKLYQLIESEDAKWELK